MNIFNYASKTLKRVLGGAGQYINGQRSSEADDVVIASFAHSGGEVLRSMLTDIASQQAGIDTRRECPLSECSVVPSLDDDSSSDPSSRQAVDDRVQSAVNLFYTNAAYNRNFKKCVYVYRDATDVLCLLHEQIVAESIFDPSTHPSVDDFCLDQFADWQLHLESCLEGFQHCQGNLLTVSFESLQHHSIQTLIEISNFAGLSATIPQLRLAVENHATDLSDRRAIGRIGLETATFNQIQNLAQPLYRRAMMVGSDRIAA